jgi:glycosidase
MHIAFDADADLLPQRTAEGVRFIYDAADSVTSVALAGTFNSWIGDALLFERVSPTRWACTLRLDAGRHLYKLVINGSAWIADPANPWISEDGQHNSCLTIGADGAVLIRQRGLGPHKPGPLYQCHQALASPAWLHDAVIYQLSVRAFGGGFDGVRLRLDYLAQLGVNTIWMMPIHPLGVTGRRGALGDPYAVRDFEAIDPALGDAASLHALVAAIHAHGMRLIYDWTINRSSIDNLLTVSHPEWFTHDERGALCYAVPDRDYFAGFDFRHRGLRRYLCDVLRRWVVDFQFDGIRLDDSDITPTDFLAQLRAALVEVHPAIAIISQAYDEFHHLESCDLSYEGGTREMLRRVACGQANGAAFAQYWNESTYSFPRGALRLRWLEEKETARANVFLGPDVHRAGVAVLLAMDGVPHILMGQEFAEPTWRNWTCLFDDYQLDWHAFDHAMFEHYRMLIDLRRRHSALRHGALDFIAGLSDGVIGLHRTLAGERIVVFANLSEDYAPLPSLHFNQMLYGQGWDERRGGLDGHGFLLAMSA